VDFEVTEEQPLYLVLGAVGESGTINRLSIDFNGYETYVINAELKPNWGITYRGDDTVLVYDEVGRLESKIPFKKDKLTLSQGPGNIRISAEFSAQSDMKLEGYVRLKGKTELFNP